MMLDGTLCERCGTLIGEPVGYPRYCEDCQSEDDE
ncbi:putative OB-fold protein [Sporomusaceae bacterium BoRhaA]|nr:putative OB-fold protein [Pelorhabdus rhamnosifermentans]